MHAFGRKWILLGLLCSSLGSWAQTPSGSSAVETLPETAAVSATAAGAASPTLAPLASAAAVESPVASPVVPVAAVVLTKPGMVAQDSINGADTAWMMTSTALVLLMTLPGIALFYGGMVRKKSVINAAAGLGRYVRGIR